MINYDSAIVVSNADFERSYNRCGYADNANRKINWLPLRCSPELGELVGYIFADGSVERSYGKTKPRPKRVDFICPDETLQKRAIELFDGIFDRVPEYKIFRKTEGLRVKSAAIARALWLTGIPMGAKVYNDYDIPKWIMTSNYEVKRNFIRAYFDCDASKPYKHTKSKCTFCIRLTINKVDTKIPSGINFLNSMKKILNEFGVETAGPYVRWSRTYVNRHGDKTVMLELLIQRHNSFVNYSKNIGFLSEEKKNKLEYCANEIMKKSLLFQTISRESLQ